MFRIEMLPVAHGDALWITFGPPDAPRRILIDGGVRYTYKHLRSRILELPPASRVLDLLVITHVDGDHIEGAVRLLQDEALGLEVREIWFNGQPQLDALPDPAEGVLGPEQGEFLGALIEQLEERLDRPLWNTRFERGAVMVPADGELQTVELGGLKLTVVSPGLGELLTLKDHWDKVVTEAGFEPGDTDAALERLAARGDLAPPDVLGAEEVEEESEFDAASEGVELDDQLGEATAEFGSDQSPANGSSIAVLAEWEGRRHLLAGDAYAPVLAANLRRWLTEESARRDEVLETVSLELFKLPHHGSVANVSEDLLGLMKCHGYLVSTSGKIFGHPHDRAIELVIRKHQARGRPQLYFNYRTGRNARWDEPRARDYEAHFPTGMTVEVSRR